MLLLHDTMLNCSHDKDASRVLISNEIALWHNALLVSWNKGPTQVKYRLLISSIFDAMNFRKWFGKNSRIAIIHISVRYIFLLLKVTQVSIKKKAYIHKNINSYFSIYIC